MYHFIIMKRIDSAILSACALGALSATAQTAPEQAASDQGVVLRGDGAIAQVVPGRGGRLMFFGPGPGTNLLWTAGDAVLDGGWKNFGGEKTWVGDMSVWRGFNSKGRFWPPPAWFDQDAFQAVATGPTNLVLRQVAHTSCDWTVALERDFRFEGGRLTVRETLTPCDPKTLAPLQGPAPQADTNDSHRVWSVTQVPFVPRLAVRLCGKGRMEPDAGFPESSGKEGNWTIFDISGAPDRATLACDADGLAVEEPTGWLVISQRSDARFLAGFAKPGRALVYTTGAKPGAPETAYTELEFVALGRDAAHEIEFRFAPTLDND